MEPLFFVMAIMGCSDGNINCADARVESARYATIQQCNAAMGAALRRNSDIDYPVISATCRAGGATHMVSTRKGQRES